MLGIVGESGSGKSVTALSIMRLIDAPGRIVGGEVLLHDDKGTTDLLQAVAGRELEHIRGNKISMIFQDPMTSLNPVLTHRLPAHRAAQAAPRHVGSSEPRRPPSNCSTAWASRRRATRLNDYPHQFSGGMRQRVMIAMALACRPRLLIADEPTTALDVTIQAQILDLISELKDEIQTAVIIITHDLGVIAAWPTRWR